MRSPTTPGCRRQSSAQLLVVLLLYAYCLGLPLSRKIEKACYEDLPFRVLSGNQQPDHTRISEFRRRHLEILEGLFLQVLQLCQKAGLVQLGHVALDGTKMEANASKHKSMSHERMEKSEEQIRQEMRALLRKADLIDAQADRQFGKDKRGDELPAELQQREDQLERIRQAKAELEVEAAESHARKRQPQAEQAARAADEADAEDKERKSRRAERMQQSADGAKDLDIAKAETACLGEPDLGPRGPLYLPSRGLPTDAGGNPKARAQRNLTDPDSHIMKAPDGYIQGYNAQAPVDSADQIIVAIVASNQAPYVEHLYPMLERIKAKTGTLPDAFSADTGFCSEANIEGCEQRGLVAYIPKARQKHGARTRPSWGQVPRARASCSWQSLRRCRCNLNVDCIAALLAHQKEKNRLLGYALWSFALVGFCGIQRFYLGHGGYGLFLLFTFGGCGVAQLIDLFLLPEAVEVSNRSLYASAAEKRAPLPLGKGQPVAAPSLPPSSQARDSESEDELERLLREAKESVNHTEQNQGE